jgi:hypothetical protein
MNTFVTIKLVKEYEKVSYYSICGEGGGKSLFEEFVEAYNQDSILEKTRRELVQIMALIKKLGEEVGAKDRYFRNEGTISDTKALPSPNKQLQELLHLSKAGLGLRLYCMVCSKNVVILYSGAVKTKDRAQDCPNVAPHLRLANKLTKAINEAFASGDIRWNTQNNDIEFDEDFEFEI